MLHMTSTKRNTGYLQFTDLHCTNLESTMLERTCAFRDSGSAVMGVQSLERIASTRKVQGLYSLIEAESTHRVELTLMNLESNVLAIACVR